MKVLEDVNSLMDAFRVITKEDTRVKFIIGLVKDICQQKWLGTFIAFVI
jgi:hypothetical protein